MPANVYSYNAAAPDVEPAFGSKAFLSGGKFTWDFYIVHGRGSIPHTYATPAQIAENKRLQIEVDKEQKEVTLESSQIDADKVTVDAQRAKWLSDSNLVDSKRLAIDQSSQESIDDFNRFVNSTNDELTSYQQSTQKFNAEVDAYNLKLADLKRKRQQQEDLARTINGDNS